MSPTKCIVSIESDDVVNSFDWLYFTSHLNSKGLYDKVMAFIDGCDCKNGTKVYEKDDQYTVVCYGSGLSFESMQF